MENSQSIHERMSETRVFMHACKSKYGDMIVLLLRMLAELDLIFALSKLFRKSCFCKLLRA